MLKIAALVAFAALLAPSAASEPQEQEQEQEQEQNEPPCVYPSSDYPDCSAIDQEQLPTNAYDPAACVAKSCGQCYFDHSSGDGPGGGGTCVAFGGVSPTIYKYIMRWRQRRARSSPTAVGGAEGSNDKVLLLEAGGPSAAALDGSDAPAEWAALPSYDGTTTRFDMPGEYGNIAWTDDGSCCSQYMQAESDFTWQPKVLGGGGMVNGALTMRPPAADLAEWPDGWQLHDLAAQFSKLEADLTLTATPSTDGVQHATDPRDAFEAGFAGAGYDFTRLDSDPDARASTYSRVQVTAVDGARQSSATAYLPTAKLRALARRRRTRRCASSSRATPSSASTTTVASPASPRAVASSSRRARSRRRPFSSCRGSARRARSRSCTRATSSTTPTTCAARTARRRSAATT